LNDIRDSSELEAFEAAMVSIRLVRLTEEPIQGAFDAARLQETHRRIFGGVYEWAGQFRKNTGTMTKQREAGNIVTYGLGDISAALDALLDASNVAVNRPAVDAGLAILNAGGDFADGLVAYEGSWLGAETFVSFDKKGRFTYHQAGTAG
jgi:hypothetical protein